MLGRVGRLYATAAPQAEALLYYTPTVLRHGQEHGEYVGYASRPSAQGHGALGHCDGS